MQLVRSMISRAGSLLGVAGARRPATDYHSLLSRAVANLNEDSYVARGALYDHARQVQLRHLLLRDPPLSDADFAAEQTALEEAIRQIEFRTDQSDGKRLAAVESPRAPLADGHSDELAEPATDKRATEAKPPQPAVVEPPFREAAAPLIELKIDDAKRAEPPPIDRERQPAVAETAAVPAIAFRINGAETKPVVGPVVEKKEKTPAPARKKRSADEEWLKPEAGRSASVATRLFALAVAFLIVAAAYAYITREGEAPDMADLMSAGAPSEDAGGSRVATQALVYKVYGDIWKGHGQRDRAIKDYRRALSYHPDAAMKKEIEVALEELGAAP